MNDIKSHASYSRYIDLSASKYRRFVDGQIGNQEKNPDDKDVHVHGSYGALLLDQRWKAKRLHVLERDQHRCVICQKENGLQVHHRQYHFLNRSASFKKPWEYEIHLMITLCETCHRRGHSRFEVPIIYK